MENAGAAVAETAAEMLREAGGRRVLVCCGKGNNGGDGFAAVRHLVRRGYEAEAAVLCGRPEVTGDALVQLRVLEAHGAGVRFLDSPAGLGRLKPADLVVDALLGTGLRGPATGLSATAVEWINRAGVPVLSVDVPSGLNSDTGAVDGVCVRAKRTVTLAEMKRGLWLYPGRGFAGRVTVADIGIPETALGSVPCDAHLLESSDALERLPGRPADSHKGTFGKVLVVAGSTGMTGAASLCALAALRSGAGLVVLGVPEPLNPVLEAAALEVITKPLPATPDGALSLAGEPVIRSLLDNWADAVAIGPGLSRHPETSELVRRLVLSSPVPVVLDADGLNAFEGTGDLVRERRKPSVLTPHAGELSRLTGRSVNAIQADRIAAARSAASAWETVVALKGASTVVAEASGNAFVNPTGNAGMATAGTGDVLTGLVAGFLGQGVPALDAALCGVYVHGLAGDVAAETEGERALVAGDLVRALGRTFRRIGEKA
jgi:NAD(P)H-hydrate epimerase